MTVFPAQMGLIPPVGFWTCDRCGHETPYIDADGCNDDPARLDTGYPSFHLIGYFCEPCWRQAAAELKH